LKSPKNYSPLRYPGGKSCLTWFLKDLANLNGLVGGTYLELYAGGAGAALNLLFDGIFSRIHINDYDYHIYAMWYAILHRSDEFVQKIHDTEITIAEWNRQQEIYQMGRNQDILHVGFATFFLNRTNRSGIIFKAGPIGGLKQTGNYKIDVRFNKADLIKRVEKIVDYKNSITLTNLDAVSILNNVDEYFNDDEGNFIYLDPPYYNKGRLLYLNNYIHENHLLLASTLSRINHVKWLVSYDNVEQIREMYASFRMSAFDLNYTLQSKKFGSELLVFSDSLLVGERIIVNNRQSELNLL
jgi:DNA adenine methylase